MFIFGYALNWLFKKIVMEKQLQIIMGTATIYEGRTYHQYNKYGCDGCDNELQAEYNPPFYTKILDTGELLCTNCASKLDK